MLSVIVPSYNMEAYLPKCLNSLVVDDTELLQKLDVIVVNDGSKDRTSEIAHDFEKRYPGVFRVIDKSNGHYGSCINAALPLAKGEYVKVLDADDWFTPGSLRILLRELEIEGERETPADLVLTDYVAVNERGDYYYSRQHTFSGGECRTLADLLKVPFDLMFYAYAYRRSVFDGLDYHQSEGIAYTDPEWAFYPMSRVKHVRYVPVTLYSYLLGREGQSVNAAFDAVHAEQLQKVLKKNVEIFNRIKDECTEEFRAYATIQLVRIAVIVYNLYLLKLPMRSMGACSFAPSAVSS